MMAERNPDSLDIDGPAFDPNTYLEKVFKECSLRQVMDLENEIVKDTQTLHSDMQTLVYENYNKFISATETIRKMKNDFKKMEDEMDLLMTNMDTITSFSDRINSNLQENRDKISHLSGIHSLLQRLQFLFKLPATLKSRMEDKNYIQATQDYLHAQRVLMQYGDMPAFQGIKGDCEEIVCDLKKELRRQFCDPSSSTKELTEAVDLLLQLDEPAKEMCTGFLASSEKRLSEHMVVLKDESEQRNVDEFIDLGCSGFLSDLSLIVGSFYDMFINRVNNGEGLNNTDIFENFAAVELEHFVQDNMSKFFELMRIKVESESDVADTGLLVQALDHFYEKVGTGQLSKSVNFVDKALGLVVSAGRKQCNAHLQILKVAFADSLAKVKQALTTVKLIGQEDSSKNLSELLNTLTLTVVEKMKGVLQDLVLFINPDLTFANKSQFKESFCSDVRESLVVCFLQYITTSVKGICSESGLDLKIPPTFILLLSKFCLDFKNNNVQYLLSKTDEIFTLKYNKKSLNHKSDTEISSLLQSSAHYLLNYYVRVQGHNCSQMLRKSVETRDWLHTIEPRTVRAVMKRVVEDISAIDATVALLYEDPGHTTGNSSDSSRKAHSISMSKMQYKSNWSSYTPSHLDSTLVSNMHKLFSERVDIFSPVEFTKVSILTGIIKISLKTFMECVRLKTFSKYGLQQIQVDTHYLQLYLWRFVADENLVHYLLDEILGSTVHRCLEPVLMEPSVVEIICERG